MDDSGVTEHSSTMKVFRPGEGVSRVGLFGGTFDPVHLGHLRVVLDVKEAFGLEKIIVIPSAVPPHKTLKHVSDAADRLNMTRICFEKRPGFVVSDVELNRRGPSYTIDTINHFRALSQPGQCLKLIMGTDAFFELHTWRSFRNILAAVPLIVMKRPGSDGDLMAAAERYLITRVDPAWSFDSAGGCFVHGAFKPVFLHGVCPTDESSTEIRRRIKNNLDVSAFLLPEVAAYIGKKGLYR